LPEPRARVIVADDHKDLREEITELLREHFDVLAVAGDGMELFATAFELQPDLVVTDIQMPRLGGIEAARQLLERNCCRGVVALTMHCEKHLIDTALCAGIQGCVAKIDAGQELINAVRTVLAGGTYLSREVLTKCRI
jgi:DNA-binding NarL/FixJ family response regulator